jgi:hypothetical protein
MKQEPTTISKYLVSSYQYLINDIITILSNALSVQQLTISTSTSTSTSTIQHNDHIDNTTRITVGLKFGCNGNTITPTELNSKWNNYISSTHFKDQLVSLGFIFSDEYVIPVDKLQPTPADSGDEYLEQEEEEEDSKGAAENFAFSVYHNFSSSISVIIAIFVTFIITII